MFLTQKLNGTIKGQIIYNWKHTRDWISWEEYARQNASLENIIPTVVIDAHK